MYMNKKVLKFDLSTFINLVNFCINASLMSYRDVKYLEYIFLQQLKQYLFQKIHISVEKCNVSTFFILVIFFYKCLINELLRCEISGIQLDALQSLVY